jgi:hypothetical protein
MITSAAVKACVNFLIKSFLFLFNHVRLGPEHDVFPAQMKAKGSKVQLLEIDILFA